jgi:membrane-bound lytic murein transglycosylase D
VLLALGAAACGPGRQPVATAPAPVAEAPPPAPADTVQAIGEGFTLGERPAAVGADLLGSAQYDLPVEANQWVRMEVDFLVNQRGPVVAGWMTNADRYGEWVRDVFASYGIPRDLSHLGMVESGYRPTVRSHAGAVGMWQFMPATGRGMGLRIDDLVDERMDPVRSTHAAARHLRDLNRQFRGDWALAAAAYNAGTGRISRGLGRFGVTNFWDLAERGDLAQETRHYVPRLYAVTIIAKDPTRFGLPARGPQRQFAFDSLRVDLQTPLSVLAAIGNIPLQEMVDLNPHLVRQVAPARYWVWVPAGQGTALASAFATSEFRQRGGYATYRVREGDTLERLAELSGLSAERIRSLNLSVGESPQPGAQLRLFADAARVLNERPMPRLARAETSERSSRSRPRVLGDPPAEEEKESSASESEGDSGRTRESSSSRGRRESAPRRVLGDEAPARSSEGSSRSSESSTRRVSEERSSARSENSSRTSESSSRSAESASGTRRALSEGSSSRSSEGSSSRSSEETASTRRASSDGSSSRSSEGSSSRSSEGSSSRSSEGASSTRRASSEGSASRSSEGSSSRSSEGTTSTRRASGEGSSSRSSEGSSSRASSSRGEGERSAASTRRTESSDGERSSSATRRTESSAERASGSRTEGSARSSSSSSSRTASESSRGSGSAGSRTAGRTHEVAEGETLWGIARRYDVTVAAVREANDLSESEAIQPGRTLRIPRSSSAAAGASETRTASGSPSTAARSSGTSGTRASASGETRPASGSSSAGTRSATAGSRGAARPAARQHTVADGETLWGIARRYEITVDALRRANDLGENAAIQPGQRLTIPAS